MELYGILKLLIIPVLSKFIDNYSASLYIKNIEQWIDLVWKSPLEIITTYGTSAGILEEDDYRYQYQRTWL